MATKGFWARTRDAIARFFQPPSPPPSPAPSPPPSPPSQPGPLPASPRRGGGIGRIQSTLSRAAARIRSFFRLPPRPKKSPPPRPASAASRGSTPAPAPSRGERVLPSAGGALLAHRRSVDRLKKMYESRKARGGKQTKEEKELWRDVRRAAATNPELVTEGDIYL